MRVSPQKCLDAVLAIASGTSIPKALMSAGYSETTANHKAGGILSGRKYTETARKYVEGIAALIGTEAIAAEWELISNAKRWTPAITSAIRTVREKYEMSDTEKDNKVAVHTKPRAHRAGREAVGASILAQPKYSEQVQALVERGQKIDGERLGHLAAALLENDLAKPPRDARSRTQLARTGLEAAGRIGAAAVEMHLHQHNHATLPPVVQAMLESKMLELLKQDNRPTLAGTIVENPPEPIHDKATATAAEWKSEEEAALELLRRNSAGQQLKTVLAGLQETARQGAQVGLRELADKEIHR